MNRFFRLIRTIIVLTLVFCAVVISSVLYYMEFELPDIEALNTVQLQVPLEIYSRDNKLIATFGEKVEDFFLLTDEANQPIGDQALLDQLREAIVAGVDGDMHHGKKEAQH